MFTETTILVREVCNGIMAVSALTMLAVFISYVITESRTEQFWYNDPAVHAAVAIIVLTLGHFIRALSGWMEFVWLDFGKVGWWVNTVGIFMLSTILIVLGKLMIVYTFSPAKWRWQITLAAGVVSITIPIGVTLLVMTD